MKVLLSYDGNEPVGVESVVRQEAWDIRQAGAEGDFNTEILPLENILTQDLENSIALGESSWRGWTISYLAGAP